MYNYLSTIMRPTFDKSDRLMNDLCISVRVGNYIIRKSRYENERLKLERIAKRKLNRENNSNFWSEFP